MFLRIFLRIFLRTLKHRSHFGSRCLDSPSLPHLLTSVSSSRGEVLGFEQAKKFPRHLCPSSGSSWHGGTSLAKATRRLETGAATVRSGAPPSKRT